MRVTKYGTGGLPLPGFKIALAGGCKTGRMQRGMPKYYRRAGSRDAMPTISGRIIGMISSAAGHDRDKINSGRKTLGPDGVLLAICLPPSPPMPINGRENAFFYVRGTRIAMRRTKIPPRCGGRFRFLDFGSRISRRCARRKG